MSVLSITLQITGSSREGLSKWQLIICPRYFKIFQIVFCCMRRELNLFALWQQKLETWYQPAWTASTGLTVLIYYLSILLNWSATTLKKTDILNNIDHLATGQYSTGKPWILEFMLLPITSKQATQHPCRAHKPPSHTAYLDDIGSPAGACVLPHHKNF